MFLERLENGIVLRIFHDIAHGVNFLQRGIEGTCGHAEEYGTNLIVLIRLNLCSIVVVEFVVLCLSEVTNGIRCSVGIIKFVFLLANCCRLLRDAVHDGVVLVVQTAIIGSFDGRFQRIDLNVTTIFNEYHCALLRHVNEEHALVANGVGEREFALANQA